MVSCKYWDCGWCYAPDDVKPSTSATPHKQCLNPDCCLNLKSQMTKNNSAPDIIEIGGVKYQRVEEEPEELKTLYQMLYDEKWCKSGCDEFCDVVKRWMSQYTCDYVMCGEYLKGYEECLTVLEENLK